MTKQSHIYNQIHPEFCSTHDKGKFKRFYVSNKIKYDLIIPEDDLDALPCYTKQIKIQSENKSQSKANQTQNRLKTLKPERNQNQKKTKTKQSKIRLRN